LFIAGVLSHAFTQIPATGSVLGSSFPKKADFHSQIGLSGTDESMRNTTKLKHVLKKYSLCMEMDEDEQFTLNLMDKADPVEIVTVQADTYAKAVTKAYGLMKKSAKKKKDA
jgi:hypothetical protein